MRLFAVLALLAAAAPAATTGPVGQVTPTSATVTGMVDPNGIATTFHFEYGTTQSYGLQTPDSAAGTGADPVTVEATLANLTDRTPRRCAPSSTSTTARRASTSSTASSRATARARPSATSARATARAR
jgi:hypothetical protein